MIAVHGDLMGQPVMCPEMLLWLQMRKEEP